LLGLKEVKRVFDRPLLGIHRPYLSESELSNLSGDQAISYAKNIREVVDSYLREMGVPYKYSDKMFSIPPDEIQWIDRDDFSADLEGLIRELREWVKSRINSELAEAKKDLEDNMRWLPDDGTGKRIKEQGNSLYRDIIKQLSDPISGEAYVTEELADDAWVKAFGNFTLERPTLCAASK
jgi:hypothetical protein